MSGRQIAQVVRKGARLLGVAGVVFVTSVLALTVAWTTHEIVTSGYTFRMWSGNTHIEVQPADTAHVGPARRLIPASVR